MITNITFNTEKGIITNDDVFLFIKKIDKDLYKSILKVYKKESFDIELLDLILEDIKTGNYGWTDSNPKERLKYDVINIIKNNDSLKQRFKYIELDEDINSDGADQYEYYKYVDITEAVKLSTKKIQDQIKILKKFGKIVKLEIS